MAAEKETVAVPPLTSALTLSFDVLFTVEPSIAFLEVMGAGVEVGLGESVTTEAVVDGLADGSCEGAAEVPEGLVVGFCDGAAGDPEGSADGACDGAAGDPEGSVEGACEGAADVPEEGCTGADVPLFTGADDVFTAGITDGSPVFVLTGFCIVILQERV